jgi:hypothetical protein
MFIKEIYLGLFPTTDYFGYKLVWVFNKWSLGSVTGIATGLATWWMVLGSNTGREKRVFCSVEVQTGSGAHPATFTTSSRDLLWGTAFGA